MNRIWILHRHTQYSTVQKSVKYARNYNFTQRRGCGIIGLRQLCVVLCRPVPWPLDQPQTKESWHHYTHYTHYTYYYVLCSLSMEFSLKTGEMILDDLLAHMLKLITLHTNYGICNQICAGPGLGGGLFTPTYVVWPPKNTVS